MAKNLIRCLLVIGLVLIVTAGAPARVQASPPGQSSLGPSMTVLVLDVSGSMGSDWSGGIKIDSAKSAANQIVSMIEQDVQFSQASHPVSLVSFSDDAYVNLYPTSDYAQVRSAIAALTPLDMTNIGASLVAANSILAQSAPQGKPGIIILLSDGKSNQGMSSSEILSGPVQTARAAGTCIYTVAFGDPGDIDVDLLQNIASGSGCGQYYAAGNVYELERIYIRIRMQSTGTILLDYQGTIAQGQTVPIGTFTIGANDVQLASQCHWVGSTLDLRLRDPNGTLVDPNYTGASYNTGSNLIYLLIGDPIIGTWTAEVYGTSIPSVSEYFDCIAAVRQGQRAPAATIVTPQVLGGGGLAIILLVVAVGVIAFFAMRGRRTITGGTPSMGKSSSRAMFMRISGNVPPNIYLRDGFTIGRERGNNLVIPDPAVSRSTAIIRQSHGRWFIQDTGSHSGILVNGVRTPASPLNTGDRIRIGSAELEFRAW